MADHSNRLFAPDPPTFLDPLSSLETCFYYSVPAFFEAKHPNTRWLINRVRSGDFDVVKRKIELSPAYFRGKYFQVLDNPAVYSSDEQSSESMYHRKCVLYLTALGMAVYLRSASIVELMLSIQDEAGKNVFSPDEEQFASHLQDSQFGDFHAFPPSLIMIRREAFECAVSLLRSGWQADKPVAMPMRRRFERRVFYFLDWLDIAFAVLQSKSFYPLPVLISSMTQSPPDYEFIQMPIDLVKGLSKKPTPQTGLVELEDLPLGTQIMGLKSLKQLCQEYSRYLQMRAAAQTIQRLKREAAALGLNPQLVMQQAKQMAPPGRNNNAASRNSPAAQQRNSNARPSKADSAREDLYCSEPLRVVLFSLLRDTHTKSLQQCLDTVAVYVKRGYFINIEREKSDTARARDTRNMVTCLLALINRENLKIKQVMTKYKELQRLKKGIEERKQLENRKRNYNSSIHKIVNYLTTVLLHSKELPYFLANRTFPPYSADLVDYELPSTMQGLMEEVKFSIRREYNSMKDAWMHMNKEMERAMKGVLRQGDSSQIKTPRSERRR